MLLTRAIWASLLLAVSVLARSQMPMSYVALAGTCAAWVFCDARLRNAAAIFWSILAAVLGPLALPVYLAKRPLKEGEIREGGFGWQLFKNLALLWTLAIGLIIVKGFTTVTGGAVSFRGEIQLAGIAVGFGVLVLGWLSILIGIAVIALLLKKSSIIEKGLDASAHGGRESSATRGWMPWAAAVGFLSIFVAADMAYGLYDTEGRRLHAIEGDPPLVLAARKNDLRALQDLSRRGSDIGDALETALRHEHSQAANLLLSYIPDRDNALRLAASNGHRHAVQSLLSAGVNVDSKDKNSKTALMLARDAEIANVLLSHGADVNGKDEDGKTPLMLARDAEIANVLLSHGADANARDKYGQTVLMLARDPEIVRASLSHGADVNAKGIHDYDYQFDALTDAVIDGNPEIVELLLDGGAAVNAGDLRMAVLDWACHSNNATAPRIFEILMDHGARPANPSKFEINIRHLVERHYVDAQYAEEMLRIWSSHPLAY
jgi:ankyrin repeat protein